MKGNNIQTLRYYVDVWLRSFWRSNTIRAYKRDVEDFLQFLDHTGGRLDEMCLMNYARVLSGSQSTVARKVAAVSLFLEWARKNGVIDVVPFRPSIQRKKRGGVYLSADEVRRLIDVAFSTPKTGLRDGALVLVLVTTWLRRSELARMDFEHIYFDGMWRLFVPESKGGRSRLVVLSEKCVQAIFRLKELYGDLVGPVWRSFSNNSFNKRLSGQSIYQIISNCARRAGLDRNVNVHLLRHTGITQAALKGVHPSFIMSQAGHTCIDSLVYYTHAFSFPDIDAMFV